jgi:predicted small lipoprotein YifL
MTRLPLAALALAVAAACGSSAPYTVPAAAVNTGVALGLAGAQRANGGCYAVCTNGTVCNPRNGLCESAKADVYCQEAPGGGMRCVPLQIGKEQKVPEPAGAAGVSPATGTVAPPPAEASPRSGP